MDCIKITKGEIIIFFRDFNHGRIKEEVDYNFDKNDLVYFNLMFFGVV